MAYAEGNSLIMISNPQLAPIISPPSNPDGTPLEAPLNLHLALASATNSKDLHHPRSHEPGGPGPGRKRGLDVDAPELEDNETKRRKTKPTESKENTTELKTVSDEDSDITDTGDYSYHENARAKTKRTTRAKRKNVNSAQSMSMSDRLSAEQLSLNIWTQKSLQQLHQSQIDLNRAKIAALAAEAQLHHMRSQEMCWKTIEHVSSIVKNRTLLAFPPLFKPSFPPTPPLDTIQKPMVPYQPVFIHVPSAEAHQITPESSNLASTEVSLPIANPNKTISSPPPAPTHEKSSHEVRGDQWLPPPEAQCRQKGATPGPTGPN